MTEELVERLLAGNKRALARALTHVENRTPEGYEILRLVYPKTGRARIIGITGPAGSGKSTLSSALAREERRRGRSVGIVAVDPSSPFSHGALLGDRIRMQDLAGDPGVFVRSMATRGALGGLAETAGDIASVLDAAGHDVIILETVGAGQDEVDVAGMAQTTVVVNTPGMGDAVQALKAGILEIADILVVNKADRPSADALVAELEGMLGLSPDSSYQPPVLRTVATTGEGIVDLADAIDEHHARLAESGDLHRVRLGRARQEVLDAARM
ncbi:MAG TPA: methylmalonyl Co-A mutase-associated GTPase MeaB, partial [Dehalococcoidia bacterium]|nr:methylmalonyl Co-A mutase-associated GTPase MeaB [Dehalococcoidia bacterium]